VSGPKAGSGRTTAAVRILRKERRVIAVAFIVLTCSEMVSCMKLSLKLGRSENGNEDDRGGGKQEQRGEPSHSYNKGTVTSLAQLTTASDHECKPRKAEAL